MTLSSQISQKEREKKGMGNLMSHETALYGRLAQKDNAQPHLIP